MDLWFIRNYPVSNVNPSLRLIRAEDTVIVCEDAVFSFSDLHQKISAQLFVHAEHSQIRGITLLPEQAISTDNIAKLIARAKRCITL